MAPNQGIRRLPLSQRWWKSAPANATDPYLLHTRCAYPFRELAIPVDDPALRASFAAYNALPQDEHMIWYRQPVLIEPSYGFALTGPRTLLLQSMPYYERVGLPDFVQYVRRRYITREPVHYERCVISLREFGDDNYYHVYSDVLGRLALLDRWPATHEIPIVISSLLARRPYFQQAIARSTTLRHRRWIVHARGFIHADSIVLPKVMPHQGGTFDFLLDLLQPPPADLHATRRIFLTRRADRQRQIVNADQVAQICAAFGFEIIDSDDLDLEAQMRIFASALHGRHAWRGPGQSDLPAGPTIDAARAVPARQYSTALFLAVSALWLRLCCAGR